MLAWDALTAALDELDAIRAQLREARGQVRTARFYKLIRAKLVLSQGGGHVANVIELSGGWVVVHWLHDQKAVGLYSSILSVQKALCAEGLYLLSLTDSSERMENTNRRSQTTRIHLTDTQKQLLRYLGHGMSNAEIAETMGFALQTVKNYTSEMYAYLGVHGYFARTQAALLARDLDLEPPKQSEGDPE